MRIRAVSSDKAMTSWFRQFIRALKSVNQPTTAQFGPQDSDGSTQTPPIDSKPETPTDSRPQTPSGSGSQTPSNPRPQTPNADPTSASNGQPNGFLRPVDPATFDVNETNPAVIAAPLVHYLPIVQAQKDTLEEAVQKVAVLKGKRSNAVIHRGEMALVLSTTVRQFISGVLGRIDRREAPVGDRMVIQHAESLPKATDSIQWVDRAEFLLEAENELVALGREPMSNPSAQKLETAKTNYDLAATAAREAEQALVVAQTALKRIREEAQLVVAEINAFTRFIYAKLDPTTRRRIMRTLGFNFYTETAEEAGETEESEVPEQPETPEVPGAENVAALLAKEVKPTVA